MRQSPLRKSFIFIEKPKKNKKGGEICIDNLRYDPKPKSILQRWNLSWFPPDFFLPLSARELELEDRQSRLQQELRERMAVEGERRTIIIFTASSL